MCRLRSGTIVTPTILQVGGLGSSAVIDSLVDQGQVAGGRISAIKQRWLDCP